MSKYNEWKNVERKNVALSGLVARFPAFTKIYKENLLLRQERREDNKVPTLRTAEETTFIAAKEPETARYLDPSLVEEVIKRY